MNVEIRRELPPVEFIRRLFAETEDGKVSIAYQPFLDQPYTVTYDMDWTAQDAQWLEQHYEHLAAVLERLGMLHDALADPANREKVLTEEELDIWNTYLRPFEGFQEDPEVVAELYFRRETDTLQDDEEELLDRHHRWFCNSSLERLPYKRCSPAFLINRAQRYAALARLHAPEVVIREEGRNLAEELAIYHFGPQRDPEEDL